MNKSFLAVDVPYEAYATGHIYRPVYTNMFLHRTVIETKCEPIVMSDMGEGEKPMANNTLE